MIVKDRIRIGAGSGFADDRFEPALELACHGDIDYLVFECLAERTIARETLSRLKNPDVGYSPYLAERIRMVLPDCIRRGIRIVTNMGAANPIAAARVVSAEARELGLKAPRVAAIVGDDVADVIRANPQLPLLESGEPVESLLPRMASANAYLGADVVSEALEDAAGLRMLGLRAQSQAARAIQGYEEILGLAGCARTAELGVH